MRVDHGVGGDELFCSISSERYYIATLSLIISFGA